MRFLLATATVAAAAALGSAQTSVEYLGATICLASRGQERCLRNHVNANESDVEGDSVDLNDPENAEVHSNNFRWKVLVDDDVTTIRLAFTNKALGLDGDDLVLTETRSTTYLMERVDPSGLSAEGPWRFRVGLPTDSESRCIGLTNRRVHLMACDEDSTELSLTNYASWRPTPSPTAPTSDAPSRSPTPDKGFPPVKEFLENVILLKSFLDEGSLLGLGMSPGDNLIPAPGDKLQIKSFLKNHDKGYLNALKMVWEHDEHFQLRPTQDAIESPLALTSNKGLNSLSTRPLDKFGYIQLTAAPNGEAQAKATFHFVEHRNGYRIMVGNDDDGANGYRRKNLCVTAAACDPHVDFQCRPNSDHVGCERTCDSGRTGDKRQGIINGSYVKLARCRDEFDEAQTFVRGVPEDFLEPGENTAAPTAPTRNPTQPPVVAPTTPPPSNPPSNPPSAPPSDTSGNNAARSGDDGNGDAGLIAGVVLMLLVLLLLIVMLVMLRRRKRKEQRERDYRQRMEADFLDGDDDNQDEYASFETDKLNLSGAGLNGDAGAMDADAGAAGAPRSNGNGNSLQERMINMRARGSRGSFDPHVQHLEQETGFVARV